MTLKSCVHIFRTNIVPLDALQSFVVSLIGVVEGNLKLVDVSLKLLLDAECLGLRLLLRLHRGLHGFHGTAVVLPVKLPSRLAFWKTSTISPGVVELFLLLCNPTINLLLGLAELEGSPQHLVLLGLESTFGFPQSLLHLLLLRLEPPPLFVQLVNGPATISKLVQKILECIGS